MISPTVRIHISKEHHQIYDDLVSKSRENPDDFPFATMKDLFMMAAAVGMKEGKYKEVKQAVNIFSGSVFDTKNDVPVMAAIAFGHQQDFNILFDEAKLVKTVEGYANGGIGVLQRELVGKSGRVFMNLVDMLLSSQST